ncbi:MAG TPA: pyridoxal-phosphate dependent enzyme [Candidatus Limnocylindria bacterium]|nr:pyridoxal-phosphate dependent enzyme [Candidatus Limnocylindria bacterium]
MTLAPDRADPAAMALDPAGARELVRGTLLERIGDTPLLRLRRIAAGPGEVWVKLEGRNPGGSVKDRAALWMVLEAERRGELDGTRRILEATSGNMGVALAMVGAVRGHAVTLCMPDRVSLERRRMAAAFGAEIVATDPLDGTDGAILEARRRFAADPARYVYLDQYSNPANPAAHEATTGPEIWAQTGGRVTHLVAGVGTSGTVMGAGAFLRPRGVRVVGVQPDEALHGLEGLKHMPSVMRPAIWEPLAVDEHATQPTAEAVEVARRLAREEGIFCGPSGGAAVAAALRVARRDGSVVVALLPDGGERYLSTPLWE